MYARGQGCSVDEAAALQWKTIPNEVKARPQGFILVSVAGGRHNSGQTE